MPNPYVHIFPDYDWRNKHENVRRQVARLYSVWNYWDDGTQPTEHAFQAGMMGLMRTILDAEAAGRRLRPLGGSWSLSEVAATNDFLVDTKALNTIQVGLPVEYCAPEARARANHLVFVQCGASILEINQQLEARGLSLKTSGASNGQTFAGALSTGTHGAANTVGSMQEYTVGLHVLRDSGESTWIERASAPVASDALLQLLGVTTVYRDDQMFRAALVGVGTFGLIHGVVFEAEPIYLLERYARTFDVDDVRQALRTLDVTSLHLPGGAALPFHFEVVVNAYAAGKGKKGARVRFMYKRPYTPQSLPPEGGVVTAPGDDLLGAIGVIGDILPDIIPAAVGKIIDAQVAPVEMAFGTHSHTFGSTTIRGAGMSLELGVAAADAEKVLDVILETTREHVFGCIVAFRFVKSTDTLLGFTRFAPRTCTVEIPSTYSPRTTDGYELLVQKLQARNIDFTLHWGQCLPVGYNAEFIKRMYGQSATDWVSERQRFLPSLTTRRMFASQVLDRAGLSD